MKLTIKLLLLSPFFLFLPACGSDCEQVEIEKAEWKTRYEEYSVDTLVHYSVKDSIKMAEYPTIQDKFIHRVTIMNNDKSYSNMFAVEFRCQYYDDDKGKWTETTQYIEIPPESTYTFEYEWRGARGTYYSDFSVTTTVLQRPQRIQLKRRIDELHLSTITVNTCRQSVEALQNEYRAVKDLYYAKVGKIMSKHTVVAGETLSGIAQKYEVTIDDLRSWNSLSAEESTIRVGQELLCIKTDSTLLKIVKNN